MSLRGLRWSLLAASCALAAVAPTAAASRGSVENGVLVYDHAEPSQLMVQVFEVEGGVAISDYEAEAGPGCEQAMVQPDPEGNEYQALKCTGVGSLVIRGRDRDEGVDPYTGGWYWERIQVDVPLPATVTGLAGRDWVTHEKPNPSGDVPVDFESPMTLDGGGAEDHLQAGAGNDTLTGGAAVDLLKALAGDDRILAKDGEKDSISCGPGHDTVEADAVETYNPNPAYACEIVNGRPFQPGGSQGPGGATKPRGEPGRCSKLRGRRRAKCIKKSCGRFQTRAKRARNKKAKARAMRQRKACVRKVTRR